MNTSILKDLKVVEVGTVLAAPLTGGLLADFGADVIKVEDSRNGDPIRKYPPSWNDKAVGALVTNRNKRNISLNFRAPGALDVVRKLVKWADVFIMNGRPDDIEALGLGYEDLKKENESIIAYYLTGYGMTGPLKDWSGFARVAEAFSGLTYITGFEDREPVFSGYPVADGISGIYGAFAIMMALWERVRSGEGQRIDLALYEPIIRMMEDAIPAYMLGNHKRTRHGNRNPFIAPNTMYKSSDGKWIAMPLSTSKVFEGFCALCGKEEWLSDPRYKTSEDRVKHREQLEREVQEIVGKEDAESFITRLNNNGVAAQIVYDISDIVQHPHIKERDNVIYVDDQDTGEKVPMPGIVPKYSRTPGKVEWVGKRRGENTREILENILGMTDQEISNLESKGAIK